MARTLSVKNLYDKKHKCFDFDGELLDVMGNPEKCGIWLIWGNEKNGKTWGALLLADYISKMEKVLYISGEEGTGKAFIDACRRANLNPVKSRINFTEYETIPDIYTRLQSGKAARVVIIDNVTVYNDELKNGCLSKLKNDFPDVLFIFLAHEERGEPYTATAKLCRRLASIIIHVEGLACMVSGRCPGGRLFIDEQKAALYHGQA